MIMKLEEENKKLVEAQAGSTSTADAEQAQIEKIPVPRKACSQNGAAYAMGDIVMYLKGMLEVKDAKMYYDSVLVGLS
jgi:hypothetical protein